MLTIAMPFNAEAGKEKGGGGAVPLRKAEIQYHLARMKTKIKIVNHFAKGEQLPAEVKNVFDDVNSKIVADLNSPYEIIDSSEESEKKCEAKTADGQMKQVPASSEMNQPGTSICFDVNLLERDETTLNELVGIAYHEHAHHFGYLDKKSVLSFWVSQLSSHLDADRAPGLLIPIFPGLETGECKFEATITSEDPKMTYSMNIYSSPRDRGIRVTGPCNPTFAGSIEYSYSVFTKKLGAIYSLNIFINGILIRAKRSRTVTEGEYKGIDAGMGGLGPMHLLRFQDLTNQLPPDAE